MVPPHAFEFRFYPHFAAASSVQSQQCSSQRRSLGSTITFREGSIETDPCDLFEGPAMNAGPPALDDPHPKPTDVENLARIILTFRRQFRYSWEKVVDFVRSIGFVEMGIHEVMGLFARYGHDARMGSRRGVYDTPGIIDGGRYDQPFGGFINAPYNWPRIPQGGRVEQQQPCNPYVGAEDMGRRHSHDSTNATISAPPTPRHRNGIVG
ncbi:MAG: hypothetical protein FRX48_08345 [Lasallia pustulata]|uniref:Uncharacterized protein n=1 Tax=Lasallia pustulata TaxID=136370 RepID=A0A5M8PGU9_9LECA|nr:MAG: hypothetical protein FRX48_08345 [Lasallia pustulata]